MPVDPRALGSPGLPPQADVLRRLAELETAIARIERSGWGRGDAFDAAEVSTTSSSYVSLGGPSVTVNVPQAGAPVLLMAVVEWAVASLGGNGVLVAHEPTAGYSLIGQGSGSGPGIYPTFTSSGFFVAGAGGSAGPRTYEMRYAAAVAGNRTYFKNRRFFAWCLG